MREYKRNDVLCIGSLKIPQNPFSDCDLVLVKVDLSQALNKLNTARAIIIAEPQNRIGAVRQCLVQLRTKAEEYGLSFFAIVTDHIHGHVLAKLWDELKVGEPKRIYLYDNLVRAAHDIFTSDPGPPLGSARILTSGFRVSQKKEKLLRRAFYDFDRIYLRPLEGGKNSLNVFCVDAWLKNSEVGPRPLPFFIKIADPKTVEEELLKYRDYAEFFIPFYLRPNLDRKRSVSIGTLSSIVGNLVEDSQPLRSVLRLNPGPGIIFSLFENSLKGFRLQHPELGTIRESPLEDFIKDRTRASEIPNHVTAKALKLGLKMSPVKLETELCNTVKDVKYRLGPYHADLHPGNVMVRGKDAILIDFSSADNNGSVVADPAAIEISLVFGTDAVDQLTQLPNWRELIKQLYYRGLYHQPPIAEKIPGPHSWLRRAVREIRHISLCCECSLDEKSVVYAAYLMRFARLPIEKFDDPDLKKIAYERHAYALVVAEKILHFLLTSKKKKSL